MWDYLQGGEGTAAGFVCEAYGRDLEQFAEFLETRAVACRTGVLPTGFAGGGERVSGGSARACHVESRSIARKLSGLRGFYRWLLMDKRVAHDPTVNVETPASWKVLPKSLAEDEVAGGCWSAQETAARAADADGLALRDHAILELLYAGGLRVGEICALRGGGCAARSAAGAGAGEGR